MKGIVSVNDLKVYAFHGCLPEEAIVGTQFLVNVDVHVNYLEAAKTDDLDKTVDYVKVAKICQEEMAIRAKLIETVALRIIEKIHLTYPQAENVFVRIDKLNPPADADVRSVSVSLEG